MNLFGNCFASALYLLDSENPLKIDYNNFLTELYGTCFAATCTSCSTASSMATATATTSGIPLDEFRKDVPPAWMPGDMKYPLKQYLERVKLWYRLYEGADESVGPLLAGRLRGRAQQIALNLRLPDPHGRVDVGDAALVRLAVDEVRDPLNGQVIQEAIPSGVSALLRALRSAFGEAEQLVATKSLETFFEFRRNRMPIPEWSVQWELNLEEAVTHAGLEINQVAKTYLYFKSSGLPSKMIDDLMLQVHGDMRRFEEVRTLLLRMSHRSFENQQGSTTLYEEAATPTYQSYHMDDGSSSWSAVTSDWHADYDLSHDLSQDDLYAWYEYDNQSNDEYWEPEWSETWYEAGYDEEEPPAEESQAAETAAPDETYYKGKGKSRQSTMGLGCSTCGSKWHNTHSCPLNDGNHGKNYDKGKNKGSYGGKGKSYGGKGKGFSKGKFKKGKGKGKSYGKYKGNYGKGKKSYWSDEMPSGYQDYYGGSYLMKPDKKEEFEIHDSTPPATTARIIDSPEKQDDFLTGKKVRFDDPAQDGEDPEEKVNKRLNFPEVAADTMENFHMVRGQRVCGLLVDPGAASGLIGTDTLKEFLDIGAIPDDRQDEMKWLPSSTVVTGISGQSDDTLAKVCLPFEIGTKGPGDVPASYTADLIGGHGSNCPALLPNTSLRQMRSAVLTQWFENGDGVLVCSTNNKRLDHPESNLVILRLLLTESGHYILPIKNENKELEMSEEEQNRIKMLWKKPSLQQPDPQDPPQQSDQATTLEQTRNPSLKSPKEKLQFTSDAQDLQDRQQQQPQQVAEDEPPIQVLLGDNYNMEYDDAECQYQGDVFPGHLPDGKLRYLQKMYRAIPEEYYSKTKKQPVTPRNARSWMKKQKTKGYHFWEWCSGSGRLTLLALLSGLCVLFPIDYRYGWDLSHPDHQRIIHEIEQDIDGGPEVLMATPSCRPWSISSTRRDLNQTQQEREAELPTVNFIKKTFKRRCKNKKGNILEQPWSSALWEHLQDLPGELHRTDQCRYKACDEQMNPILKPTGLHSDFHLKHSISRCRGHQGRKHGWLQGAVQGMNRTTMAAVYPEALCRALVKDIKYFIDHKNSFTSYYKCERCAMGRAATADLLHSKIPGECRYGSKPEKKIFHKDDIFDDFRTEALENPKVMQGKLSADPSLSFSSEQTAILKLCFIRLLTESIHNFEKAEKEKVDHNYIHWLKDPVPFGWIKRVLEEHMTFRGAMACLQPWSTPTPHPQLTVEEAPLRMMIRGHIGSWRIGPVQDLRSLDMSQWHEPLDVGDDWLIAIFGHEVGIDDAEDEPASASSKEPKISDDKLHIPDEDDYSPMTPLNMDDDDVPICPPAQEEEPAEAVAQHPGSLKPLFDFRRVFDKLPKLAGHDDVQAKRLILGLHERLWHAPAQDVRNILKRCGMPPAVIQLAAEAVSSCRICRKFARAGRRPQYKGADLAQHFNETVQIDLFKFDNEWYLLTIDEATRYKIATKTEGRDLDSILDAMMRSWIRYFGPMKVLISDQETSLMTVGAGTELQRLGIQRRPGGTTSKKQGQKHTATGLVEKHADMIKLTMHKLRAEAERWGIEVQGEELAAEASMAANTTHNVGGYAPVTMLFGIMPRGFLEPEEPIYDEGIGPDESSFERAVRLRQIALQASQAAILESRIARANRSRPQRLPVEDMVPGTTKVELFRDDGGGYGWRGPATVLQIDSTAGTAIVEFQGRPYLVGLRHLRPLRESYLQFMNETSSTTSSDAEAALSRMKAIVEQATPFRPFTMGEILKTSNGQNQLVRFPKEESETVSQMLKDALTFLNFHRDRVVLHGLRFGKGLKTILVPRFSKGTLLTWTEGIPGIAITEHNTDSVIHIKELFSKNLENLCHIYIYGYVQLNTEESTTTAKISRRPDSQQSQEAELDDPMSVTSSPTTMDDPDIDEPNETSASKRKGPETRTVVLAPEKKKLRTELHTLYLNSMHWMLQRSRKIRFPMHHLWSDDHPRWIRAKQKPRINQAPERLLLHLHCRTSAHLHIYLLTGEIYRVDEDTDVLSEEKVLEHWSDFEESDKAELKQFIDEKVFRKVKLSDVEGQVVLVDATWVRKFKRTADKKLKAKSRLCARGFLDPQKQELPTRSTTATRLSQRLVLSMAACHKFNILSWDVSGAFLKGFSFAKVKEVLRKKGVSSPDRRVVIIPPANVWRHLASFDSSFAIGEGEQGLWGLECNKPAYGLNDAPLAWQLCLHESLESSGGVQSLLDENMWHWKTSSGQLRALMTTHVDDIAVAGTDEFLDKEYKFLCERFGKISIQKPPFSHCGCRYNKTGDSYVIDQQEFIDNMKVQDFKDLGEDQQRALTPAETTILRSILGGLLWVTATRLDLVADVGVLQSRVTKATVQDLHLANSIVKKAKMTQYNGIGITYRHIPTTSPWRLLAVHDAASASKDRAYSQEGIMILLCRDHLDFNKQVHTISGLDVDEANFGGDAHILFAHGARAKRVSYSTSHSETLAAISGLETATLVSLRLAELLSTSLKPTLQQLSALQESGVPYLPVDVMTDCKDFYSLTTGVTSLPQDKSQRIYILAHREARLSGRIRWTILIPTQSMVSDALTKVMLSKQLLHLLSSGQVIFKNEEGHPIEARRLPPRGNISEDDLCEPDDHWIEMSLENLQMVQRYTTSRTRSTSRSSSRTTRSSAWLLLFLAAAQVMRSKADGEQCSAATPHPSGEEFSFQRIMMVFLTFLCMAMASAIFYLCCLVRKMNVKIDQVNDHRVQPLVTANLADRVLSAEHNVMELQLQLSENVNDIDLIYRSLRRRAGPHPEEPSRSRARTIDSRPPAPEPEGSPRSEAEPQDEETLVRPFNDDASRSHDDDDHRALRHGEDEHDDEDEEEDEDGSIDDYVHDPHEQEQREVQLRGILHTIAIEANNMEYALFREHHGRTIPLQRIIELYESHAPSIPPPGTYMDEMMGVSTLQGRPQHFLQEHSRRYGDTELLFESQYALYRFRNLRIRLRRDSRLDEEDFERRLDAGYANISSMQGPAG